MAIKAIYLWTFPTESFDILYLYNYLTFKGDLFQILDGVLHIICALLHLRNHQGLGGETFFHIVHIFFQRLNDRIKLLLKLLCLFDGSGKFPDISSILIIILNFKSKKIN